MIPRIVIKVCGITRREDAEFAAEAGATAIGFIFYPKSPRYVTPQRAAELGQGLDVWKVGVFVDESPVAVEAVMRAANLDVVQLYGGETPQAPRVWRAFRLPLPPGSGALDDSGAEAVLLDGPANGVSFDWKQACGAATKIVVAGGLDASNVAEAIRVTRPWGVDASSRLETAPGIKDRDKVRQFVKAALQAE
ncbi:MAG TPA: phosphoribosylanthranilate isomerase [Bryobacteraceae bacterium]|nr:phosphoribosylanthranilate isomerase [Bryobacteraceae bacterium]